MVKPIQWEDEKVRDYLINNNALEFARIKTPHGLRTTLRKELGVLEGKCFPRSLQFSLSSKHWCYAEGFVFIKSHKSNKYHYYPHAWVVPREESKRYWCLDFVFPWKKKIYNYEPLDNFFYHGMIFEPRLVADWLKKRKGSCSLFKYLGEWDYEELKLKTP